MSTTLDATPTTPSVRMFGRFQLLRLLGKSERTMAWRVADPRSAREHVLVMPRQQPIDATAFEQWMQVVRRASRVQHPRLAPAVELGERDGWPFVAYDGADATALSERIGDGTGLPAIDVAQWMVQALEGLAFAHDAGVAHHDLQPYLMLIDRQGHVQLIGLEVALDSGGASELAMRADAGADPSSLHRQRVAAQRDVLSMGVLMHVALAGSPALDEPDVGRVIAQLPPRGQQFVRLPWSTALPVPDTVRAIVNRAIDRQERRRYPVARSMARALAGWLKADAESNGGPLALLLDRLHSVGLLPASPGSAERVARMALMETDRTNELAEVVLQDFALSFEMLRAVNSAQVRGAQAASNGPVLTLRRAIALLGLDGVRRAALSLRPWPGPLEEEHATRLSALFRRVARAARLAQLLRPAGFDPEVAFLVTLLQNLGLLAVQYHFPEEALQIEHLMEPAPALHPDERPEPGMAADAAAYAVLGVDIDALGAGVARHWALGDQIVHMSRRLSVETPVRAPDDDGDILRALGSCANEAIDTLTLNPSRREAALQRVVQRYGRLLGIKHKDLQSAVIASANATTTADRIATHGEQTAEQG